MSSGDEERASLPAWSESAHDGDTETASVFDAVPTGHATPERFLVVRKNDEVTLLDLPQTGQWIVGRAEDADVSIDDKRVSFRHARLTIAANVLYVEDLGSHNGTRLNGQILGSARALAGIGDVLEIGCAQIVVAARAKRAERIAPSTDDDPCDVVLADAEMARVYGSARKVAQMTTTVLILGETGSGKDVLAERIHAWSSRAEKPFVRINCAGIPDALLESELFGYERGAFTGADRRRLGYFEAATEGTIFLDEIGELSPSAQVKLLHVLEKRTVTRLGGTTSLPIDVRIVCATHRDLQALVNDGRFRADLYFRISPFVVRIPPLRERKTEIPLLADTFVRQFASEMHLPLPPIAPDAIEMLRARDWPGNVRELRNAVEHAFAMAQGSPIEIAHFSEELRAPLSPKRSPRRLVKIERDAIEEALTAEGGNQTRAAARLGMPRRTLVYKLAQYRREDAHDAEDVDD
jgi:DNA-binding NtrC family response regulator